MKRKDPLYIYLVRHGHASSIGSDLTKSLTDVGQQEIHTTGRHLAQLQPTIQYVGHSNRTRTIETAQILCSELHLTIAPKELSFLGPTEDPAKLLSWIERQENHLLLVSHQPLLEGLLDLILDKYSPKTKTLAPSLFKKTGSAVALACHKDSVSLIWQSPPQEQEI